ncbi:heat shock 70 kDa protein 1A-like [Dermochelys coriacea]|uniref:heat shock 70 kDa protein 1A-like n=1 Tax=Dermochelys coriacea TaxID=27794 RepID=UPI0018E7589A|nr:heat shock 70 kDa protein 1A-like [Dermochelys coriacea]
MRRAKGPAVGIDLGTTYSCVGVFQHGKVEIIANDQGNRTTPSYVAFTDTERLVGDPAKSQAALNPQNTVFDAKRLIGRMVEDPMVQLDMRHWPFQVVSDTGKLKVQVSFKGKEKAFYPEEISAIVLTKMKQTAEAYLGCPITQAVITVPAYFNDSQRRATIDAGTIAGLHVLKILNEPTAAAIAYGLEASREGEGKRNILIFDLGGGTFDVSILRVDDGIFEVKATAGDTHLGGEDFDNRLVDHLVREFRRKHKEDLSQDKKAMQRIRVACERAKRTLSSGTAAAISIDSLYKGVDFHTTVTRARLEDLCSDLFQATLKPLGKALRDANMNKDQIHDIVLVGGSTRIPKVQTLLQEFFSGRELSKNINPDEAVAYGAAVQAAILTSNRSQGLQNVLLLDVTPLSLGIDTVGGLMAAVVKRNSPVPTQESMDFTTAEDDQETVVFAVYEGERPMSRNNHLLGTFILSGLPLARRGEPVIQVSFSIDANNILTVSARDTDTGNTSQLTITDTRGRLDREEVERMVREAEEHRAQDETQQEKVTAMNSLESCALHLKRAAEGGQALDGRAKKRVLELCEEATSWLESNQLAEKEVYEERRRELEEAWDLVFSDLSQARGGEGEARDEEDGEEAAVAQHGEKAG